MYDNQENQFPQSQEDQDEVDLKLAQDLVARSSHVLSQCSVIQDMLAKLSKNLQKNVKEIEVGTKTVMQNLDAKIQSKVAASGEESECKMKQFCEEAYQSMKESAELLRDYESAIVGMENLQMPGFKVHKEANFGLLPMVLNTEVKGVLEYVPNMTLQPNLFVFIDRSNHSTEFLKIPATGDSIEAIASFPVIFNHVTQHQSRIVCDSYVYSMRDFQKIQTLEIANVTSGCSLTPKMVCLGHSSGGLMSLIAWTGAQYQMVQKSRILPTTSRNKNLAFTEIRRDAFSKIPNQVFIKQECKEDRNTAPGLYRVLIDPRNLAESLRVQIRLPKEEALHDFRQVAEDIVVTLQTTVAAVTKIDEQCSALILSTVEIHGIPRGMVLMPGFDSDIMPLAMVKSEEGKYALLDIREKGWEGTIEGLEGLEVIGQPPDNPNWVFVKDLNSGGLGILKLYQK